MPTKTLMMMETLICYEHVLFLVICNSHSSHNAQHTDYCARHPDAKLQT